MLDRVLLLPRLLPAEQLLVSRLVPPMLPSPLHLPPQRVESLPQLALLQLRLAVQRPVR